MQISTARGAAVDAMAECRSRKSELRDVADAAYRQVFKKSPATRVQLFGSRAQGMATDMSDYDFLLELPEARAFEAKILRASIREILIDRGMTRFWKSADQFGKGTLV